MPQGSDLIAAPGHTGDQPVDTDLTAIAALTTTAYGRALLTTADQAALRTTVGVEPLIAGAVIRTAAGVPAGAPSAVAHELPFAYDTTSVTGGLYYWNGAAWVKLATIL